MARIDGSQLGAHDPTVPRRKQVPRRPTRFRRPVEEWIVVPNPGDFRLMFDPLTQSTEEILDIMLKFRAEARRRAGLPADE